MMICVEFHMNNERDLKKRDMTKKKAHEERLKKENDRLELGRRQEGGESLTLNSTADKWMELNQWDFKVKSMQARGVDGAMAENGERQDRGEGVTD